MPRSDSWNVEANSQIAGVQLARIGDDTRSHGIAGNAYRVCPRGDD